MNPEILAAAATCRVVLSEISADVADALAAVEAWASDAEPVDQDEAKAHLAALGLGEIRRQAVYWLVVSAATVGARLLYVDDCLDALAYVSGSSSSKVSALYAEILAGLIEPRSDVRDTLPPAPVEEAA